MTAAPVADATFARVIAALDVSCHDEQTLATAAEIAARLGVEVAGLFIEDINLFRLAALPVTRHVAIGPAAAAPLNVEQLTTEMQAMAGRAAAELEASAARHGVKSSFRVVRGLPAAELAAGTMTEDLLVVGAARALAGLPLALGSSLQEAVCRAGRCILHARQLALPRNPLIVLRASSELSLRAIAVAMHVVGGATDELTVLLVGTPVETGQAAKPVEAALAAHGRRARLRQVNDLTPAQLTRVASDGRSDMLILASDLPGLDSDEALRDLISAAPCDVLIVR